MSFEANAFVLRRNWFPALGCLLLFALGVAYSRFAAANMAPLGWFAAWLGVTMGPVLLARNAFPRATPTAVRVTSERITIDGVGEHANEDVLEAKVVPRWGAFAVVDIALRSGGSISLRTDAAAAHALVQVLGARRTRFRLVVPYWKRFVSSYVLLAALGIAVSTGSEWIMMLPASLLYAAIIAWVVGYIRGRLVVGADGFTTKWLFWERFIAFRDIASVLPHSHFTNRGLQDTSIQLRSGRKLRLRTVEAPNDEAERGAESRAMLAHVQAAFERSTRLLDASVDVPALVQRGARTAREWLTGLDALVRGGGSRYRVAAVSADMLTDLASDPSAAVESRVGAAAALVRIGDDAHRVRLRVVAEACAETDLRSALLALSEARDDEAAEAALLIVTTRRATPARQ